MLFRCVFVVPVLFAILLTSGCAWPGQRYLKVRIERDGETLLQTEYGVGDSLDAAAMWRSLQDKSFKAAAAVTAEKDDKQEVTLKGKIRIVITHVDRVMASAEVDQLRLKRVAGSDDQWQLTADEVKRTSRAAGL